MGSGLPSPNGASRASSSARPSVRSCAEATASTRTTSNSSSASRCASACAANSSANASILDSSMERPAAARCPPNRSRFAEHAESAPWRSNDAIDRPDPFHAVLRPRDQHDRPVEALDEPRRDDPDHALVPVLAPEHVATAAAARLGHRVDGCGRLAQDPILHCLPVAVQLLQDVRVAPRLVGVVREHELERDVRPAEPPGGVDPRSEPKADGAGVDGRRIDAGAAHERLQPGSPGRCEREEPGSGECAVLVDERDDVGDRGERDEVEVPPHRRMVGTEQRLAELVHDPGSAELGERIARRPRRDDRAVGQRRLPADGGR